MSFVRAGEDGSDVYVYPTQTGIVCCGSELSPMTVAETLTHLQWHRGQGGRVPAWVDGYIAAHYPDGVYDVERAWLPELDHIRRGRIVLP